MPSVEVKGNLNKFYEQVSADLPKLLEGAAIGSAIIFNNTDKAVNFYVYNYIDNIYLVSAMHTLVAPGKAGRVAASGKSYKVHPNDDKRQEFLVDPNKAYVYGGPGDIENVSS